MGYKLRRDAKPSSSTAITPIGPSVAPTTDEVFIGKSKKAPINQDRHIHPRTQIMANPMIAI